MVAAPPAAFGRGSKEGKAQSQALGKKEFLFVQIQPILVSVLRDPQSLRASPHHTSLYTTQFSLGKPVCCCSTPPNTPPGNILPPPPLPQTAAIQRVISKETKKKKKSQHQGKFQRQSSGSRGTSSRMHLWAPSSRNRCKQDLSSGVRTGRGSGCFP